MILSSVTAISMMPPTLKRLNNGEYSASSVLAAPIQAVRLDLVREADGNYGLDKVRTDAIRLSAFNSPAARSSLSLLGALSSLQLGG